MNLSQAGKKVAEFPILFVCGILTPLIVVLLVMRGPKVTQFEQELSALEREWHNIQTNVERASGMETDIERLEQGLEVVRQRLMQVDNVAVNYEFFFDLERESGIALSRFSQAPATDGAGLPASWTCWIASDTLSAWNSCGFTRRLPGRGRQSILLP